MSKRRAVQKAARSRPRPPAGVVELDALDDDFQEHAGLDEPARIPAQRAANPPAAAAAPAPLQALRQVPAIRADLERQVADVVAAARAAGHTWAEIGEALGVKKQTAHERYGPAAGWRC